MFLLMCVILFTGGGGLPPGEGSLLFGYATGSSVSQVRIQGGPGGPGPHLTLGFEAPKLSIFGPYLIFP